MKSAIALFAIGLAATVASLYAPAVWPALSVAILFITFGVTLSAIGRSKS